MGNTYITKDDKRQDQNGNIQYILYDKENVLVPLTPQEVIKEHKTYIIPLCQGKNFHPLRSPKSGKRVFYKKNMYDKKKKTRETHLKDGKENR